MNISEAQAFARFWQERRAEIQELSHLLSDIQDQWQRHDELLDITEEGVVLTTRDHNDDDGVFLDGQIVVPWEVIFNPSSLTALRQTARMKQEERAAKHKEHVEKMERDSYLRLKAKYEP